MNTRIVDIAGRQCALGMEWAMSTTNYEKAPSKKDVQIMMASISEEADLWTTFKTTGPGRYYQIGVGVPDSPPSKKLYAPAAQLAMARPESASYIFNLGDGLWWGVVIASGIIVPSSDAISEDGGDLVANTKEELNDKLPFSSLDASSDNIEYTDPDDAKAFLEGIFIEAGKKQGRAYSLKSLQRNKRYLLIASSITVAGVVVVSGAAYWHHEREVARRQAQMAAKRAAEKQARKKKKQEHLKKIEELKKTEKKYKKNIKMPWHSSYKANHMLKICQHAYWHTFVVSRGGWRQTQWTCTLKGIQSKWSKMEGATIRSAPNGQFNKKYTHVKTQAKLPKHSKASGWSKVKKLNKIKKQWIIKSQIPHPKNLQIKIGNISIHHFHWPENIKKRAKKLGQSSLPSTPISWRYMKIIVHTKMPPWEYSNIWKTPGYVIKNIQRNTHGWRTIGVQYGK